MKAQFPRKRRRKRKCKNCRELYMPDVRHFRDQNYCSKPDCRHASKLASHRRWYRSDKGAEYRDPEENKRRVREWREKHPKYWRRTGKAPLDALQDTTASEGVENQQVTPSLNDGALQDVNFLQPAMVVGLIASLTGSALQDTIAETSRRFVLLGQDILGEGPGSNPKGDRRDGNRKTSSLSPALAPCSAGIQLDRSPAGTPRSHQPLQP
jgi:hypothetical protein